MKKDRTDFRRKLAAAPESARHLYVRWRERVRRASAKRGKTRQSVDIVLYDNFGAESLPREVRQALALLTHPAQGWRVNKKIIKTEYGFRTRVILTIY